MFPEVLIDEYIPFTENQLKTRILFLSWGQLENLIYGFPLKAFLGCHCRHFILCCRVWKPHSASQAGPLGRGGRWRRQSLCAQDTPGFYAPLAIELGKAPGPGHHAGCQAHNDSSCVMCFLNVYLIRSMGLPRWR